MRQVAKQMFYVVLPHHGMVGRHPMSLFYRRVAVSPPSHCGVYPTPPARPSASRIASHRDRSSGVVRRAAIEGLEGRRLLSAVTYDGTLDGKIVYLSGGHGFAWDGSSTWQTGRGETNEMVEDFGNQDQLQSYADYLLRAGATVVPMRPIGHQLNEVVLDNASAGVTYSGTWSNSTATTDFYGAAGSVPYRYASVSASQTAVATYAPTISSAGFYPVYAWTRDGPDRATDQLYRVNYAGGSAEVTVNHKLVGKGWIYLGTYYFGTGTGGWVQISNKSSNASGVVIADAVRFGNGMGTVKRNGAVSGRSREDEASLYWIEGQLGVGVSISSFRGGSTADSDANVGAPARYAAYMNNAPFGQSVYMGFHSNAAGADGTTRGTYGLYNSAANATPNQQRWAFLAAKEVNADLVAAGSPPMEYAWFNKADSALTLDRSDIDFGEIRSSATGDEFDATILEVAFHDNVQDAALMRDPVVRDRVGRATYQATVRYFGEFGGGTVAMAPAAPTGLRTAVAANGDLTLNWAAPAANGVVGDAATMYVLYVSRNGYGFDVLGTTAGVAATNYTIPAAQLDGGAYYFEVAAANAGGESPTSAVAGARKPPNPSGVGAAGGNRVLVVNGFDRLDRTQDARQSVALSTGGSTAVVDRVWPRVGNSFDYVVRAGTAIAAYAGGVGFDSAGSADIAAGRVDLTKYQTVVWLSGEESTADETFSTAEQSAVFGYLAQGGRLFTSGSEIGWDLDRPTGPTTADRAFYNNALRADYVADDAGTYNAAAAAGGIFAGASAFSFDNGSSGTYDVDFPDVLATTGGSSAALTYSGGTGGNAAVQYANTATGSKVVTFGFPFETITTAAARSAVLGRVFDYFETAVSAAPAVPAVPDLLAVADSGVSATDDLTNFNNASASKALRFAVAGTVAGATIRVYADGVLIGSATAVGTTTTVVTSGTAALVDGVRQFAASQQEPGRSESSRTASLAVTVDATAPTLPATPVYVYGAATARLELTFSEDVRASLSSVDLSVVPFPGGGGGTATVGEPAFPSATTAAFGLTGPAASGRLANGWYRATLSAAGVADAAGNAAAADATLDFYELLGDLDRDKAVGFADFNILAAHYGKSGQTWATGDLNGDGSVGFEDFNLLAANYGKSVSATPPPMPAAAVVKTPPAKTPTTAPVKPVPVATAPVKSTPANTSTASQVVTSVKTKGK